METSCSEYLKTATTIGTRVPFSSTLQVSPINTFLTRVTRPDSGSVLLSLSVQLSPTNRTRSVKFCVGAEDDAEVVVEEAEAGDGAVSDIEP